MAVRCNRSSGRLLGLLIGVTGANGFLGQALRKRMVAERGVEPRFYVRRSPQTTDDVIVPDLCQAGDRRWVEALKGVDTLIHLAAALPWTSRNKTLIRKINVEGTVALAEAAIEAGVKRFVFVSTLGVHGVSSKNGPFSPQSPIAPSGFYATTKYEAETALRCTCNAAEMELVILRPPVVYGAGVGGKIGALVKLTGRGALLPIGHIAGNHRQMIAVDNLADVLMLTAQHPQAPGAPILPSDTEGVSTFEFLARLARLQGQPLRLMPIPEALLRFAVVLPGVGTYAERLVGNVIIRDSRLQDDLGWSAPFTLKEGLRVMVDREKQS